LVEEIGGPELGQLEPAAIGSDHQIPTSVVKIRTSLCREEDEDPPPSPLLAAHLAFTSTPLAADGRPNANPRRTDKINLEATH
jgi:hypothetical protein